MSIQSISSQEKSEAVSQTEAARNVERFPLPPPFFLPRITSRRGFPPLQNAATAELLMAFHILKPVSTYPYFEWKCNYTRARRAAHPPFLLIRFFLSLSSPFFRGQPNTSGENFFFLARERFPFISKPARTRSKQIVFCRKTRRGSRPVEDANMRNEEWRGGKCGNSTGNEQRNCGFLL